MATKQKRTPGLIKIDGTWHIDKRVLGKRICESTGSADLREAEQYLARRIDQIRQVKVYGAHQRYTFRDAARQYIKTAVKATLDEDANWIKTLDPYIGQLELRTIHMGALQQYIDDRRRDGVKNRTINHGLEVVRQILNRASKEWLSDDGVPWLQSAPKIRLLPIQDARKPYPISWDEQTRLIRELPTHLARMCLFKVNTGTRETEVTRLRWEWEQQLEPLGTSVFIIPGGVVKNRVARLVVLNDVARSVIESCRGEDREHVFVLKGKPVLRINNSAWKKARARAGLEDLRVHDLKHTFGRRLRAAGVSFEDRQDLLGHKSSRITTHYSAAEIGKLIAAANLICDQAERKAPALTLLRVIG